MYVPRYLAQISVDRLAVFPFDDEETFAVLQSSFHYHWAWRYSSTMRLDINYSPSDCLKTFPFPRSGSDIGRSGRLYYQMRQSIMRSATEGLTKTYNRFHNPEVSAVDIQKLRELHAEMDHQVAAAYGWTDMDLGHDFHQIKQGIRFTVSEAARREVLDRLLALKHERHKEETAQGLHENSTKKTKAPGNKKRKKKDDSTITMAF